MSHEYPVRDHRHASLLNSFIQEKKKAGYQLVGCEILYNYFGDRGVIDVVLRQDSPVTKKSVWLLCEIKPSLFDIGDTIRQVRRAQQYFCSSRPDMEIKNRENEYRFVLVLEASPENYAQLDRFRDLFQGIEILYHNEEQQIAPPHSAFQEIQQAILTVQRI